MVVYFWILKININIYVIKFFIFFIFVYYSMLGVFCVIINGMIKSVVYEVGGKVNWENMGV